MAHAESGGGGSISATGHPGGASDAFLLTGAWWVAAACIALAVTPTLRAHWMTLLTLAFIGFYMIPRTLGVLLIYFASDKAGEGREEGGLSGFLKGGFWAIVGVVTLLVVVFPTTALIAGMIDEMLTAEGIRFVGVLILGLYVMSWARWVDPEGWTASALKLTALLCFAYFLGSLALVLMEAVSG